MAAVAAAPPPKDDDAPLDDGPAEESSFQHFLAFISKSLSDGPDSAISCVLVTLILGLRILNLAGIAGNLFQRYDQALEWDCTVNAICSLGIQGGLLLVWAAMSFGERKTESQFALRGTKQESTKSHWIHGILKKGFWEQTLMPGGFAPRIFAVIMGIILFCNQNFIASMVKNGPALTKPETDAAWIKWDTGMACRADATIPSFWWGTRWYTEPPTGCYGAADAESKAHASWAHRMGLLGMFSTASEKFYVRPNASIPNLNNPVINGVKDTTRVCMYQCAKWRILSTQTVLLHGGVVLAGGVFIERLTNVFSSKFGRYPLITHASTPAQLSAAVKVTLTPPSMGTGLYFGFIGRRLACLGILWLCLFSVKYAAARLDLDGFDTVDYYTTCAFLLSLVVATIMRSYHPHRFAPIVFTKALWETGIDKFKGSNRGTEISIDLYEWFHIESHNRARYLMNYARVVSPLSLKYYEPAMELKDGSLSEDKHVEDHVQNSKPSMKERLLGLEQRLNRLETKDKKTAAPKGMAVKCVKPYEGFADVFVPKQGDPTKGSYSRERVVIMKGATGHILGKLHDNVHCMVKWENNEKVDVGGDEDGDGVMDIDDAITTVKLQIAMDAIIEISPDWAKLEDFIDKEEKDYLTEKKTKKQNEKTGVHRITSLPV